MPYHTIDNILQQLDEPIDCAEAHGIATGLLCIDNYATSATWLAEISCKPGSIAEQEMDLLGALFEQTRQLLNDENFAFDLFLPDVCPLQERATALKNWCKGFLFGVSFAQTGSEWSAQINEILKDIIEFSKMDTDVDGEDDENALVEIVEYIRAAVILFKQEMNDNIDRPARLH